MKLRKKITAIVPMMLLLGACSEAPKPAEQAKPAAKPAEAVSALSAVYKTFTQARSWAPDAKILRVASIALKEVKSQAGKSGAWEVTFASEANGRARRYTYSVVESAPNNLPEGVFGNPPESWTAGGQAKPFLIQALKSDSTAAYEAAIKDKKGAEYLAKHPDMSILFLLEQTSRFPDPAWRVVWGDSVSTSGFSVFTDAMTGDFLQTTK
jgi:hypothetical protein